MSDVGHLSIEQRAALRASIPTQLHAAIHQVREVLGACGHLALPIPAGAEHGLAMLAEALVLIRERLAAEERERLRRGVDPVGFQLILERRARRGQPGPPPRVSKDAQGLASAIVAALRAGVPGPRIVRVLAPLEQRPTRPELREIVRLLRER
jgi:hypothetical protein